MADSNNFQDYELNEADIDKALHILQVYDPENATPENAINFLEYLRVGVHEFAHTSPEKLEELYKQFSEQKRSES